jgi:dihydrofolate synthase/folylpolyglutamate synthase
MGGRLDATNIVDPALSVITLIELEHTEFLGDTIAKIAGEKAGIIKPGRPVLVAAQKQGESPDAISVFRAKARETGSRLFYFPEIVEIRDLTLGREGTSWTLVRGEKEAHLSTAIPGAVQAANGSLAAIAVSLVFPEIPPEYAARGIADFTLPARFERLSLPSGAPPLVIDGAHTARSAEECAKTWEALYGKGGILLFGCAAGKDVVSMAKKLLPLFSVVIITRPGTFKKSEPEKIYAKFAFFAKDCAAGGAAPELLYLPETGEAIKKALALSRERGLPLLGAGSFYLAGEIRAAIKTPALFETEA